MARGSLLRWLRPLLITGSLVLVQAGAASAFVLAARADPERVQAGERATSVISVEVLDESGQPAPDRTEVRFMATLGTITPTAYSSRGMARAVLSCASTGTCEVSVLVGGDRTVVTVEFTSDAGTGQGASRSIRMEGGWVAYSVDRQVLAASDGARFRYRRLLVTAQNMQFEVSSGTLRAQQAVAIGNGRNTINGERLCYWLNQARGVLLATEDRVERLFFQGEGLNVYSRQGEVSADTFQPPEVSGTRTWIVADEVLVIPNERIQFSHASIYVNDRHLVSLPYYIANFTSTGGLVNQIFNLSSDGGLNLDLPAYYAASEKRIGSAHVRHTSRNGYYYGSGTGWTLGLEEQYRIGNKMRGVLTLDDLTSSTRGFRLQHNQELASNSRADLYLNYYRYSPDYPGSLSGQLFYYRPVKEVELNTMLHATKYGENKDWAVETNARYSGKPLGKSEVTYSVGANLGYGNQLAGYWAGFYQKPKNILSYGLQGSLYFPTVEMGPRTGFTSSISGDTRMYTGGASSRSSGDLRLGVRHALGQAGALNLNYTYSLQSGGGYYYYGEGNQRLDASLYASRSDTWYLSAFGSYTLGNSGMFGSMLASYRLPFRSSGGLPKWRLEARSTYSKFAGWSTSDLRLALGRDIGNYEVLLCYSPSGSGYSSYGFLGSGSGKQVWLELAAGRF